MNMFYNWSEQSVCLQICVYKLAQEDGKFVLYINPTHRNTYIYF